MNRIIWLLPLACSVSPVVAQRANVDYDHSCDFSRYQTYRWVERVEQQSLNQLMQERVVGFVEESLAAKRLKRVETGGDLLVRYDMKVAEQEEFTTFTDAIGPTWGWGSTVSITTANPTLLGTLIERYPPR